jgi:ABC-type branched-subunit amino acid transport system ATPase component
MSRPHLWLLDEPSVDRVPIMVDKFSKLIDPIAEEGTTMFLQSGLRAWH